MRLKAKYTKSSRRRPTTTTMMRHSRAEKATSSRELAEVEAEDIKRNMITMILLVKVS